MTKTILLFVSDFSPLLWNKHRRWRLPWPPFSLFMFSTMNSSGSRLLISWSRSVSEDMLQSAESFSIGLWNRQVKNNVERVSWSGYQGQFPTTCCQVPTASHQDSKTDKLKIMRTTVLDQSQFPKTCCKVLIVSPQDSKTDKLKIMCAKVLDQTIKVSFQQLCCNQFLHRTLKQIS